MTLKLFVKQRTRKLHLFDSFEGLPPPSEEDGQKANDFWTETAGSEHQTTQRCIADTNPVIDLIHVRLGFPKADMVLHVGWFDQTLPQLGPEPRSIAVLRLDGDWYDSTKICFDYLYDRVSPGGVILLDDYFCWEGCRKATDEFRAARGINNPIVQIDQDSGYWIKSIESQPSVFSI